MGVVSSGIRRITVCGLAVGALAATGVELAGVPASAARRPECRQAGSTVVANSVVRVYRVGPRDDYRVAACDLRRGRKRFLGEWNAITGGIAHVALAGRYVAYKSGSCGRDACNAVAAVTNVVTGGRRASAHRQDGGISAIVVRANGSIAWIVAGRRGDFVEVRKLEQERETLLDSDPMIDKESLALAGSRLYWLRGGQAQTGGLNQ